MTPVDRENSFGSSRQVAPQVLERLNTRFVGSFELRVLLTAIIATKLHQIVPPRNSFEQWQQRLNHLVSYFIYGKKITAIAEENGVSKQSVSDQLRRTLDVFWQRLALVNAEKLNRELHGVSTVDDDFLRTLELLQDQAEESDTNPFRLPNIHSITYRIGQLAQQGYLTEEIQQILGVEPLQVVHAAATLKKYGVNFESIAKQNQKRRSRLRQLLRTEPDSDKLKKEFSVLAGGLNIDYIITREYAYDLEDRAMLSISFILEEAGLPHIPNSDISIIVDFLTHSGLFILADINKSNHRTRHFIPRSQLKMAVTLVGDNPDFAQYGRNPVFIIGKPNQEIPYHITDLLSEDFQSLLPLVRGLGIEFNNIDGDKLSELIEDDCPVDVYAYNKSTQGLNYRYRRSDQRALADYLLKKWGK